MYININTEMKINIRINYIDLSQVNVIKTTFKIARRSIPCPPYKRPLMISRVCYFYNESLRRNNKKQSMAS